MGHCDMYLDLVYHMEDKNPIITVISFLVTRYETLKPLCTYTVAQILGSIHSILGIWVYQSPSNNPNCFSGGQFSFEQQCSNSKNVNMYVKKETVDISHI